MKRLSMLSAVLICCLLMMGSTTKINQGDPMSPFGYTIIAVGSLLIVFSALRVSTKARQRYLNHPTPPMLRKRNQPMESRGITTSEKNSERLKEEDFNPATAIMTSEQMANIVRTGFIIKRLDNQLVKPDDGKEYHHLHLPDFHKSTNKVSELPYLPHD